MLQQERILTRAGVTLYAHASQCTYEKPSAKTHPLLPLVSHCCCSHLLQLSLPNKRGTVAMLNSACHTLLPAEIPSQARRST